MFLPTATPLAAILASPTWVQPNVAQCAAGFDWNRNTLGQDPCTVASLLDASCRGLADYALPPLNSIQYYLPPTANHSDDLTCDCNSVMYSLYMACASCQGGEIYSWTKWTPECASTYVSQYPTNIPDGTAVPRWAYYNVTLLPNQTWNDSVAMNTKRQLKEFLKRVDSAPPPSPSTPSSPSMPSAVSVPPPPPIMQSSNIIPSMVMGPTDAPSPLPTQSTIVKTPVGLPDPTVVIDPSPAQPSVPPSTPDLPAPMVITTTTTPPAPTPNVPAPMIPTTTPTDPMIPTTTPADPIIPTTTPAPPNPMTTTTTTTTPPPTTSTTTVNSPGSRTPPNNANSSRPTIRTSTTNSPGPAIPSTGSNPLRPTGFNSSGTIFLRSTNAWAGFAALFLWALL